MGARVELREFKKAFGVDGFGFAAIPARCGNVALARIATLKEHAGWGFPHRTPYRRVNRRSWKYYRDEQYRPVSAAGTMNEEQMQTDGN